MLLLKNKNLFIISLILPFVFFHFTGSIIKNSSEYGRIPITIIDEDNSQLSKELITRLEKDNLIKLVSVPMTEANKFLIDNKIEAIFVLRDGLVDKIRNEDTDEIIDIFYLKESIVATALGDIIAAEILPIIGSTKAANNFEYIYRKNKVEG